MSNATKSIEIAHQLALRVVQVGALEPAAMVEAWPELSASAVECSRALSASRSSDRIPDRLYLDAMSIKSVSRPESWRVAEADLQLKQVALGLRAARTELLESRAETSLDEIVEGRRLIASTLWVTAQSIAPACRDASFDARYDTSLRTTDREAVQRHAGNLSHRFKALEDIAASGALPSAEAKPECRIPATLRQAIADWDVAAHRELISNQSSMVLHSLAHLEAGHAKVFQHMVDRAATAGAIDPVTRERVEPVLAKASHAWQAARYHQLTN